MLLTHQLENVQQLAEQLAISRAELGRSSLDGRATLDAADQMMQRASEWVRCYSCGEQCYLIGARFIYN